MTIDANAIYEMLKNRRPEYNEPLHCKLLLEVMSDPNRARLSAFCVKAHIGESTFFRWVKENPLFGLCYELGKMYSREIWEDEGQEIRDELIMPGTTNHKMDYWRMIGWSRFGIGKNGKVRLTLDPKAKATEHYAQLIELAGTGELTASEIKQLMEALNVGLNVNNAIKMQEEIDQLKKDLITMQENTSGHNSFPNKGIA